MKSEAFLATFCKGMSIVAIAVGFFMLFVGLSFLPEFGAFGLVWIIFVVIIIGFHVLDIVGKGVSIYEIDVEDTNRREWKNR